ncbi:hypothetical protein ACRAWG_25930 [Methylobacterium sp. P31]
MIFEGDQGQAEAPFTTAIGVFRVALVTFAREVANRDPQLAATAFAAAEAAVQARLGAGASGGEAHDMIGTGAATRNAIRYQLQKVLTAAKVAIEEQSDDGSADAGAEDKARPDRPGGRLAHHISSGSPSRRGRRSTGSREERPDAALSAHPIAPDPPPAAKPNRAVRPPGPAPGSRQSSRGRFVTSRLIRAGRPLIAVAPYLFIRPFLSELAHSTRQDSANVGASLLLVYKLVRNDRACCA